MLPRSVSALLIAWACCTAHAQSAPTSADPFQGAVARHDYARALEAAQEEVKQRPADESAWFHQAIALHGLHRDADALNALDKAHKLAPQDLRTLQAAAQLAYASHDARALQYAEAVLQMDAQSSAANGMAGVLQLEGGRCETAAVHLLRPDVMPSLDAGTRIRLAACLPQAQHSSVVALLAPLRSAETLTARGYSLLASSYAGTDEVSAAVEVLREGCARFSHDPDLYADLAILSMDHQSPDVALGVLDSGIRANPGAAELYTLRGSVYAQIAQNDKATKDFERADQLSPNEAYGALGMGMLLRDGSNLDEAQKQLEAKLKRLPGDPLLSYTLADVLIRQGANPGDANDTRAESLLRTAIQSDERLAQAYALLGKLELRRDDIAGATRDLERAVELNDHDRTALNQLIAAYRRSGRATDASRVSQQLARSADEERKREVESNRIHLTLGSSTPQKTTP